MSDYSSTFPTQRPSLNLDFANGGDQLDSRISFSRADSTPSAVHYWSNEKHLSSENLLKYSTAFDNAAWNGNNVPAPTTGQTDPSGGTGGCILIADTTNGSHNKFQSQVTSGELSFTVFAKPASGTMRMMLNLYNAANDWEVFLFDLVGGSPVAASGTSSTFSNVSATQTASGNGYYKCTINATGSITSTILALNPNATTSGLNAYGGISFAGDDTAGITVAFASLSTVGSSDYNATTSQIHREYSSTLKSVSNAGDPRFEYDPITGNSEGLLIESQATNKATYSEDFTNATYNKYRATIESASAIAPDGTLTASLLREDATASNTHFLNAVTATGLSVGTTQYAVSIFAKAAGRSRLQIYDNNQNTSGSTTFDLSNGTVVTGDGSIKSCGNGWYRCTIIPTANYSATSSVYMLLDNGSGTSYTGNSYSGILVWGYQLETGVSASSSYIKSNSGSSTTRSTDSCSVATSSFYTGGPVTIVGEVNGSGSGYRTFFDIRDTVSKASGVNAYLMVWKTNISDTDASNFKAFIYSDNVQQANLTISQSGGATTVAARMDTNNVGVCADGGAVTTDTSAVIPDSLDTLYIGRGYSGYELGSTIKRLAIYNVALSDVELQSLTTS